MRTPRRVPVVGMVCGNTITGISVSLGHILKELHCVIFSLCPGPSGARTNLTRCYSEFRDETGTLLSNLSMDRSVGVPERIGLAKLA